ncbi:MAG: hypothetical protein HY836_14330, partial [Aquabacterium sp.]|uniref:calcium-binding protein n=1 Tax=Aquabacterium sp. TaxID=1872578 RepID=UPI0025C73BEA
SPSAVTLSRSANDLVLVISSTDQIIVKDWFVDALRYIEQIQFKDGTVWSPSELSALMAATNTATQSTTSTALTGSASPDKLYALSGNDTLTALAGNDFLFAGEGNDSLDGGADNDWLWGEAGIDTLNGGAGADTMLGGLNDDTYYIDNAGDKVIELADGGRDTVRTTVNYLASDHVEVLIASGTEDIALTGHATQSTQLMGNAGNNLIVGGAGADRLYSRGGADTLRGGGGDDIYFIDSSNARIEEDANSGGGGLNDRAYIYVDNYVVHNNLDTVYLTGSAAVTATGNGAKNIMKGNGNHNVLFGAGGLDLMSGGSGDDTLRGGTGMDILMGEAGNDTYVIAAGDGKDMITNNDATGYDTLLLESANESQIWLQRSGDSLLVSVIGTSDGATVSSWFQGTNHQLDEIKVGATGKVLAASKVDALLQAMSSMVPPAAGQTSLPQPYQDKLNSVIAASWV